MVGADNREKSMIALNRTNIVLTLWLAALAIAAAAPDGAARQGNVGKSGIRHGRTASGYLYMNGGSSAAEQYTMEQRAAPYNVKLILVAPAVSSLTQLKVFIANNRTGKIENIPLSGPWLYFQLPAGVYTIGARIRNRVYVLRDVRVRDAARQTHVLGSDLLPLGTTPPGVDRGK